MSLVVSETFYSIQGEGPDSGHPAIFLRLTGCNLTCNGWSYNTGLTHAGTAGEHLGCDTKHIWRQGNRYETDELIADWKKRGWLDLFELSTPLVVTGGEPLLQEEGLKDFLYALFEEVSHGLSIRVETNGTIRPSPVLRGSISAWSLAPKLASAGDPVDKRRNESALEWFVDLTNEAVVSAVNWIFTTDGRWQDTEEIEVKFVEPFKLPSNVIWIQPEGQTSRTKIADICLAHGWNYSPRLQIALGGRA